MLGPPPQRVERRVGHTEHQRLTLSVDGGRVDLELSRTEKGWSGLDVRKDDWRDLAESGQSLLDMSIAPIRCLADWVMNGGHW